jgi:hypothetical protein
MRPSEFLLRVMNDEAVPLPVRILAASKAAPYVERRPDPSVSGPVPLPREWSDTQLNDFAARLEADRRDHPERYGEPGEQMPLLPRPEKG